MVVVTAHGRVVEAPAAGAHAAQVGGQHRRPIEVRLSGLLPAPRGVGVERIITARMLEHVRPDVVVGVCGSCGGYQQGCGENDPFHDNSSMLSEIRRSRWSHPEDAAVGAASITNRTGA